MLLPLALHRLWGRKLFSAFTLLLLVATLGTIMVLQASEDEIVNGPLRYLKHVPATYWVSAAGTDNVYLGSQVPADVLTKVRHFPGVTAATGIRDDFYDVYHGKRKIGGILSSYDPGSLAEPHVVSGHSFTQSGEAVIDRHFAGELRVGLGSVVTVAGQQRRIVGLSNETNSYTKELIFIPNADFASLRGSTDYKALALQTAPSFDGSALAQTLGISVYNHSQWVAHNRSYWIKTVGQLFSNTTQNVVMLMTVALVAFLIVDILRDMNAMAVMKQLGYSTARIARMVFANTLTLISVAFGLALLLATPLIAFEVNDKNIGMTASLTFGAIKSGLVVYAIAVIIGPIAPIVWIRRVQPALALKAGE